MRILFVLPALPLVLLLAAACGKVGDPKPPVVRIPQSVTTLAASQSGYRVVLSWTNPTHYVDKNPATDLGVVHVFQNGKDIGSTPAIGAGKAQSFDVDISGDVGTPLTFSLQLGVSGVRGVSAASNAAAIRPVDVPGTPRNLRALVDQRRITLQWDAPERNGGLADVYLVQREDRATVDVVRTTRFEDTDYERGKTYRYTVTAARDASSRVPGLAGATQAVVATDKTAPAAPAGLVVESLGAGVFLRWQRNIEADFKDVLVYRSDSAAPIATTSVDGVADPGYRQGLSYQLAARDIFDNVSTRSAPQPGP